MTAVSVIIPSLNRAEHLKSLLSDLAGQIITEALEIVVVDQSDTPYCISGDTVTYIHTKAKGPCNARHLAVEASNGEILVFLDDDARIEPDFLSNLVKPISSGGEVATSGAVCDSEGSYKYSDFNERFARAREQSHSIDPVSLLTSNPDCPLAGHSISFPMGCSAIRRDVYLQLGGVDLNFDPDGALEDRDIALRLFKNGYRVLYCPNARLFHFGASKGGRRDHRSGHDYFSAYSLNMLYFAHKHFGSAGFDQYRLHLVYKAFTKYGIFSRSFMKTANAVRGFTIEKLIADKTSATLNRRTHGNGPSGVQDVIPD